MNNVVALVNASGAVVEQYAYRPYGGLVAVDTLGSAPVNTAGHQGLFYEHIDGGAGLEVGAAGFYYNRNRFYSPALGRFLQRDPNETAMPLLTAMVSNGEAIAMFFGPFAPKWHLADGMNLYLYLGANPLNRLDPGALSAILTLDTTPSMAWRAEIWLAGAKAASGVLAHVQGVVGFVAAKSFIYSVTAIAAFNATVGSDPGNYSELAWHISQESSRLWDWAMSSGENVQRGVNQHGSSGSSWNNLDPKQLERAIKHAEAQLRKNRAFEKWFHQVYKEKMGMGGGGIKNPNMPGLDVLDAWEFWLVLGKPAV